MNPIRLYGRMSDNQRFAVWIFAIARHRRSRCTSLDIPAAALPLRDAAANPVTNPTLADAVRQQAPNGSLMPIVESLSLLCPALNDITMLECNNGTFHRINRRNALPAPVRRRINKGVAATKSDTQQVDEITTMLADKSVIDQVILKLNGPEYRAREVAGHMMGLEQNVESDILNGSLGSDPTASTACSPG
jgi:hypothetical protein